MAAGGIIIDTAYPTIEINGTNIEKTSYQNLFGAHIILNNLIQQQLLADKARIVYAGGEGARGIPGMIQKPTYNSTQEFREYLKGRSNSAYNPMNAIGVSKLLGALWTIKISEIKNRNFDVIWFSPGLTYGTNGLSKMTPIKRWAMENIGFGLMRLIGKAQSPADGGAKFAKALSGGIGTNGNVLGAPEKQTLGKITDQKPMNTAITDRSLQTELWNLLEETTGKFALS